MNSPDIQIAAEALSPPPPPPISKSAAKNTKNISKVLKPVGWFFLALSCLIFFTFIKFPETKIKNYIQSSIQNSLGNYGMSLISKSSTLSLKFGIRYQIKDIQLFWPPPSENITHLDLIEFSPSILSLLAGKIGGSFSLRQGDGIFSSSFVTRQTKAGREIDLKIHMKQLDLGKLGVFQLGTALKGSTLLAGDISYSGTLETPETWMGHVKLNISKLKIDPQSIQGFAIPQVNVSEGLLDIKIDKGKGQIQTFKLGKSGTSTDDFIGTLSGDLQLAPSLDAITLNTKTEFTLSENILKAFVLLDALLGGGKQANGSYAFQLSGPLTSPTPTPIK